MKKGLIVMLGLVMVAFLAACNNKQPADNNPVNVDNGVVYVDDSGEAVDTNVDGNVEENDVESNEVDYERAEVAETMKTSLTLDDLNEIDSVLFPKGYTYGVYGMDSIEALDSWEYVYPSDIDHSLLLPIHATMASRDVISSELINGNIYTITNVTLQDWTTVAVLYINDPVSLQYVSATVNTETESTVYTFQY